MFSLLSVAFSDPAYEQPLSVWQSKAETRAMPAKSDISLRDLKNFCALSRYANG
jgi:hypothetical protein